MFYTGFKKGREKQPSRNNTSTDSRPEKDLELTVVL